MEKLVLTRSDYCGIFLVRGKDMQHKRFIRECIRKHSKELEQGARMVMKAQILENGGKREKAVKYYKSAKKMFEQAEMFASFFGDKTYQWEAKILMQKVDDQMSNLIISDFYEGGISH